MIQLAPSELFQNTGRLKSVQGTINATLKASVGELVQIRTQAGQLIDAEVIGFDNRLIQIMPFGDSSNLRRNDLVIGQNQKMQIPVGGELLGRIIDSRGQPIDRKGSLGCSHEVNLNFQAQIL